MLRCRVRALCTALGPQKLISSRHDAPAKMLTTKGREKEANVARQSRSDAVDLAFGTHNLVLLLHELQSRKGARERDWGSWTAQNPERSDQFTSHKAGAYPTQTSVRLFGAEERGDQSMRKRAMCSRKRGEGGHRRTSDQSMRKSARWLRTEKPSVPSAQCRPRRLASRRP